MYTNSYLQSITLGGIGAVFALGLINVSGHCINKINDHFKISTTPSTGKSTGKSESHVTSKSKSFSDHFNRVNLIDTSAYYINKITEYIKNIRLLSGPVPGPVAVAESSGTESLDPEGRLLYNSLKELSDLILKTDIASESLKRILKQKFLKGQFSTARDSNIMNWICSIREALERCKMQASNLKKILSKSNYKGSREFVIVPGVPSDFENAAAHVNYPEEELSNIKDKYIASEVYTETTVSNSMNDPVTCETIKKFRCQQADNSNHNSPPMEEEFLKFYGKIANLSGTPAECY